ncbi:YhbY family RNA-binding protein [Cerasicoccus fimbriatus]|uniref:YhbY family RNA-binding protein n=1 Tax=Cerasicoccus fimbriatus TaxID=3014554 RepID=UPI0022B2BBF4|nr:YhbY family RNA-binding protein [Cerasicoccus sp. TK19100]
MLNSAEKKHLRGVAQRLAAGVHVGKQGLTDTLIAELDQLLKRDELVKVKFVLDREGIKTAIADIEQRTDSECVGSVGKTAAFYRPKAD